MLRIPILDWRTNEVTEMKVKGWKITIYRDQSLGKNKGKAIIAKGPIEFVLTRIDNDFVQLEKWTNHNLVETKLYHADGVNNCHGMVYINDHSEPKRCYAFWRSNELQTLLDSVGIDRLVFSKSTEDTFDYETPKTSDEGYGFQTDGAITEMEGDFYHIYSAKYFFRRDCENGNILVLSRNYDVEYLTKELLQNY